jgi:photosystem II stability/assembly factor-like uncharacterized protein
MTTVLASLENLFLVLESTKDGWRVQEHPKQQNSSSVFDPQSPERAYCGTFDNGLWKTDNNGQTWEKTSLNVSNSKITSISVSPTERGKGGFNRIFVGMEPSTIYSSIDGAETWNKIEIFVVASTENVGACCGLMREQIPEMDMDTRRKRKARNRALQTG